MHSTARYTHDLHAEFGAKQEYCAVVLLLQAVQTRRRSQDILQVVRISSAYSRMSISQETTRTKFCATAVAQFCLERMHGQQGQICLVHDRSGQVASTSWKEERTKTTHL